MFHHGLPGPKLNSGPSRSAPTHTHTPCLYKQCSHKKIPAGCHAPAGPKWILSQQRGEAVHLKNMAPCGWFIHLGCSCVLPYLAGPALLTNAWGSEVISHISPLSSISKQFPSLEQCNSKLWHTWNACHIYATLNSLMLMFPENVTHAPCCCTVLTCIPKFNPF